jgi:hypothetical protein
MGDFFKPCPSRAKAGEQRYSIHLLNKDTVKLLLPNQWAEVNQAFLEHCLVILEKEVIDTISPI